jgi:hypothetical protein
MKKMVLFLLCANGLAAAKGQVLLNLQLPPAGIYLKSQLWNFSITRMTAQPLSIKVEMTFTDASNGQRVMTASSGIVTLAQQVTQLQASSLAPIAYNVVNNAYQVDINPNGFLPVGRFEVCYAVIQANQDVADKLAEDCETIEVEPVSPPLLVQPADGEQTDAGRPFFTWLPPAPAAAFGTLQYDWVLVQVLGNQTPADAVLHNMPLHAQQYLGTNSLLYPASLPPLDTGKTYAWQVSARSTGNAISKSEVFSFSVRRFLPDTALQRRSTEVYTPLKREQDAAYATAFGAARFEYLNETRDTVATVAIRDISHTGHPSVLPGNLQLRLGFGLNYLSIDLTGNGNVYDKRLYLLELVNSKGERWYLKFEYRKPANQ